MELYKFLKKEHFDLLLANGTVRVGTLMNYRSHEQGTMVTDRMEGAKNFSGGFENLTSNDLKQSYTLSTLVEVSDGSTGIGYLDNIVIEEPNYFIFSVSDGYSKQAHEKWFEQQAYDYCYKIIAPNTFFRRITRKLNEIQPVEFIGIFPVRYYNEKAGMDFFDPLEKLPAFTLKDYDEYSEQNEIRAVWRPKTMGAISPIDISYKGLSSYIADQGHFLDAS
ncbi:MAG: hypothetical protein KZQ97_11295 [Candidatus Thiodiazotropha sp. (ex Dulcina madagascariensis)]|nr:hypothetical protein [Candidatus Thiodiazotropha sp. (ex Dulcina madagascariensis)]